jgi:hypothetical protein
MDFLFLIYTNLILLKWANESEIINLILSILGMANWPSSAAAVGENGASKFKTFHPLHQ